MKKTQVMDRLYLDTGICKFLTKKHDNKDQKEKERQVDDLTQSICKYSGIDLYSGFKSVWAAGLYLERIGWGSKLLKEITKRASFITVTDAQEDYQLKDLFNAAKENISKIVDDVLNKKLPLPLVPNNMIGYAGEEVVNDLNGRYTNEQKEWLVRLCLEPEALQQTLFEKLKGSFEEKKKAQKYFFHTCLPGFFKTFLSEKRDINLSRMMLHYYSIQQGIGNNKKQGSNGEEKRLIDPNKDIADGELIHFAIFGTWVDDKLVPVQAITFDNPIEVRRRLCVVKSITAWLVAHKQPDFKFQHGKVLCVDKDSFERSIITIEKIELEPWVHKESSDDARTWLKRYEEGLTT